MYFRGEIYDPVSGDVRDYDDYELFIQGIQQAAFIELDEIDEREATQQKPPKIEDTYLWIKVMLSEAEKDLEDVNVPYFRLNKIIFHRPVIVMEEGPSEVISIVSPAEILSGEELQKAYPKRNQGSLYISGIGHLSGFSTLDASSDDESAEFTETPEDRIFELEEKDIQYPKDSSFDWRLSSYGLKSAIKQLGAIVDKVDRDRLIKEDSYKKAFFTVCFFTAEAARFDIVKYGAMNMLNLCNSETVSFSKHYQCWSRWKPIIQFWRVTCEHLDRAGQRGIDPLMMVGIPIKIDSGGLVDHPAFQDSVVRNVLSFFPCEDGLNAREILQNQVLEDFSRNYPIQYGFSEAIFPGREGELVRQNVASEMFKQMIVMQLLELKESGKKLFEAKEYREALGIYVKALSVYNEQILTPDPELLLPIQFYIGASHYKLEEYASAQAHLEKSSALSEELYGKDDARTIRVKKMLDSCSAKISSSKPAP